MFYFSPLYFVFALPALLLGMYAQYRVSSAYNRFSRERNRANISGLEAAQRLLSVAGLQSVGVSETQGQLSDHYDPRNKRLFLSSGVARNPSVAALGIVAHEVGHAVQDQQDYAPMKLRSAIVPAVQIGSWLGPLLFLAGLLLNLARLPEIGLILFSTTLVFALVTLPVEFNASNRALALLRQAGLTSATEERGVQSVLSAAALTYVAAAVQALSTILYYLFLLGGRRRR
jgi:Zn-dependent membrane protease YugP